MTNRDPSTIKKVFIDADIATYQCGFAAESRMYVLKDGDGHTMLTTPYKKEITEFLAFIGSNLDEYELEKRVEPQPLSHAIKNVSQLINSILENTKCKDYQMYITGEDNFRDRYAVSHPYKGNRDSSNKPTHYKGLREWMVKQGATLVEGQEADDSMSIAQYNSPEGTTCIATIDKDLDNTPGWHYNFNKQELYWVTEEEAKHSFYKQILMGDRTDNIHGLDGIGEKKALKAIDGCQSDEDYVTTVIDMYMEAIWNENEGDNLDLPEEEVEKIARERIRENGILLWMRREEDEIWEIPNILNTQSS